MTVDSSVAECGESGNVLQHQSQEVTEADGSTPSLLSPAETAVPLKLCPVCASIAEKRRGYDWGKVGCSSWECPIRGIAFYPERWNDRPLDKAVDEKYKQMQEKLHNYGSCVATIYSLAEPLRETNGVCGAIAEFVETYAPKAVENSQKKST